MTPARGKVGRRGPPRRIRAPAPARPAAPPAHVSGENVRRLEAALQAAEVLLEEKDREIVRLKQQFEERLVEFEGRFADLQREVSRARMEAGDARQITDVRVRGVEQQLQSLAELLEGLAAKGQVIAESTQAARGSVEALQERLDQLDTGIPPRPHHRGRG